MKLVERHIIKKSNKNFKNIDDLAFKSKNLYNVALYTIKNHKENEGSFLNYNKLERKFRDELQVDFFNLPTNTSQQILMLLDKNLKSYFGLLRKWKNDKNSLSGCPKFPKYKHKTKGRNIIIFTTNQARLKSDLGIIKFPKNTNLEPLSTNIKDGLKQVRIIPQSSCYVIEVVYEKQEEQIKSINDNYLSIDFGIKNLITGYDNNWNRDFIISGKPLLSMNHYFNKQKAEIQSGLKKNHNKYNSNKLNRLTLKRNNKIKDYLHKCSKFVVDYCLESDISTIVVGYNKNWKVGINLGTRTNQNFTQIPYRVLVEQIKYKCELYGINFIENEESYTSKCSSIDLEPIKKSDNYLGKRIKRGLFQSKDGIKINADLNGAINILRKVTGDKLLIDSIKTLTSKGQVVWPLRVSPYKEFYKVA